MKRPKIEDYQSRQPPLVDYLKFYEYISHLEQYCSYLEDKVDMMRDEIKDLKKQPVFVFDNY